MEIIIEGKVAALKKGSSFDYIAENRHFTGSDSYTLSMEFPLRGCKENVEIFGNIHRVQVNPEKIIFDCEIRDKAFSVRGSLTIVDINEVMVKCQFLEGRSAQNFRTDLDEIYLNELQLFEPYKSVAGNDNPLASWKSYAAGGCCVALPWVNNNSGNIQNDVTPKAGGKYSWNTTLISLQPYLIHLLTEVFRSVHLDFDVSSLVGSSYEKMVVFNTLPTAWDDSNYAHALPHWSITEFIEELEKFLFGKFHIDYQNEVVTFEFNDVALTRMQKIEIANVIDEFSEELTEENGSDYEELRNLKYAECDHEMWKYYDCDWFLKAKSHAVTRESFLDILADKLSNWRLVNSYELSAVRNIHYAIDAQTYFMLRYVRRTDGRNQLTMQPLNIFGPRIVDTTKSDDAEEINIVPVWIDDTTELKGQCVFLDLPDLENDDGGENSGTQSPGQLLKTPNTRLLETGTKEQQEFLDKIYVGFWDNQTYKTGILPRPFIDKVTVYEDFTYIWNNAYSLRLNDNATAHRQRSWRIDGMRKYTFSFLSNTIPNPRSVFYIRGKRYLCSKISATFTETGMSQRLKGEFYQII